MKISCDIAMDLIALYSDDLASEDSKNAVREHLKECPSCKKAFSAYRKDYEVSHYIPLENSDREKYAKIARSLRHRQYRNNAGFAAVLALSVGIGIIGLMKLFSPEVTETEE